jgi:hypothetical protein
MAAVLENEKCDVEQPESPTNEESVKEMLDMIFRGPTAGDGIERSVSITTMDTSAGGTKTACGCCPKKGC